MSVLGCRSNCWSIDIFSDSSIDFKVDDVCCTSLTLLSTVFANCAIREAIELKTSGYRGTKVDSCALDNVWYSSKGRKASEAYLANRRSWEHFTIQFVSGAEKLLANP